jgi:mannose-1-phosphate guanylyltransferase
LDAAARLGFLRPEGRNGGARPGIEGAMKTEQDRLWALVLAGGDGTRLQSLTRQLTGAPIPKQYCRILGDRSLLEATLERLAPLVGPLHTLAVVNRAHLPLARPQLAALPTENVLVQPRNRDTGPGILLSLLELRRRDPGATVAMFPSDHDVRDERAFRRYVTEMTAVVARHPQRIALLGARPDRVETGYGYIAPGSRLPGTSGAVFRVRTFHEKPDHDLAARIIRRGGLWNSFVMVGRVARLLDLLGAAFPDEVARLAALPADPDALAPVYEGMAAWNFSRDFLQRIAQHLVVTRGDHLGWSDWGTPESIERTFAALGLTPPWQVAQEATA